MMPAHENVATEYELRLIQTKDATGYFMPVPGNELELQEVLAYLEAHPNDAFMHRYGLEQVMALPPEAVSVLLDNAAGDRVLMPLLLEACLLQESLKPLQVRFPPGAVAALRHDSPLILLRSANLPDQERHREWIAFLKRNLLDHRPLGMAPEAPYPGGLPCPGAKVALSQVAPLAESPDPLSTLPSFEAVAHQALERLE
ncbi:MAG TPA: hypothetical protein VLT88_13915, partial [Desulfosarcina sp.]|nr:hypothetical protein [Desulfosarcina sp.]